MSSKFSREDDIRFGFFFQIFAKNHMSTVCETDVQTPLFSTEFYSHNANSPSVVVHAEEGLHVIDIIKFAMASHVV